MPDVDVGRICDIDPARVARYQRRYPAAASSNEFEAVLADESIMLPAWTRVDATLGYETKIGTTAARWSAGVDNVFDRRYWRESPLQFGHVYLYTGAPRTFRVALTAAL